MTVDHAITKASRDSTEILVVGSRTFLNNSRTLLVLAVASPSVRPAGLGFCGAGTEDKLMLIEWQSKSRNLLLLDQLEIQSCLKSIALTSDRGCDLLTVLGSVEDPAQFQLTWLGHPQYQQATKTVTSKLGRFVVTEEAAVLPASVTGR